jgi:hypothetical protein
MYMCKVICEFRQENDSVSETYRNTCFELFSSFELPFIINFTVHFIRLLGCVCVCKYCVL